MKAYRFYIDEKVTVWERNHYTIDAQNKAEAIRLAKEAFRRGYIDEDDGYVENETIYDTMETMTVDDNDGQATRELLIRDEWNNKTIMTNVPKKRKTKHEIRTRREPTGGLGTQVETFHREPGVRQDFQVPERSNEGGEDNMSEELRLVPIVPGNSVQEVEMYLDLARSLSVD